jgi:asparagine synthase (glutamine-hydrolysing)
LAFASEIKALLTLDDVPRILNEVHVANYLGNYYQDKSITFYKDIYWLPPAHSLVFSTKGIQGRPYWSLNASVELDDHGDEMYASTFQAIFQEAVTCRVRNAYPVGFALSGGIDSTSITCTARAALSMNDSSPISPYSLLLTDLPSVDRELIDKRK